MLPIRNISYLCYYFCEKCINSHKIGQVCRIPLKLSKYKYQIPGVPKVKDTFCSLIRICKTTSMHVAKFETY